MPHTGVILQPGTVLAPCWRWPVPASPGVRDPTVLPPSSGAAMSQWGHPLRCSLRAASRVIFNLLRCREEELWCPWISLPVGQRGQGLAELPVTPGWLCWCCSPCAGALGGGNRSWLRQCVRQCWNMPNCCRLDPHPALPVQAVVRLHQIHHHWQLGICSPTCLEGAPGAVGASFTLCILRKAGVF